MNRSRARDVALWTAAALAFAGRAGAQMVTPRSEESIDPYDLPDAPAPPTLPDLTHRALTASLESTFASIRANALPDGSEPGRSFGWTERLEFEQALSLRRWYVGLSEQIALGKSGDHFLMVAGNPEVWGRALWASKAGLAYGGGLGFVVPAIHHDAEASAVARSIRVVRPWDHVDFVNDDLVFRPFIDVRDIDGPVVLQLRQGIDWNRSTGALTSRTTLYVGYRPLELLGLGLEAWEVYLIQAPERKDDGRAAYAVSPSARLMTRVLQPAVSFLLPIDRPLFDAVDSFWAIRLTASVVLEPRSEAK
ncbi:MAG TPA: hypothetical protein VJT73_06565 [Polyangiaceae bacterium]|nr:hypothetical protein [Polyangiaceae bacterium]